MSAAIPDHPPYDVVATRKAREFDDDGMRGVLAVQLDLAAAIEVTRVRDDVQDAVFDCRLYAKTHAERRRRHGFGWRYDHRQTLTRVGRGCQRQQECEGSQLDTPSHAVRRKKHPRHMDIV